MPTFFGSRTHYRDHLRPIADAMGTGVVEHRRDVPPGPVVVASYLDLWAMRDRPAVFVEHGAGQSYGTRHPAYSGGDGRDNVVLFVCPSTTVADRNRARYPRADAVAVGCPRMDRFHADPPTPTGVVGLAFHWFTGGVSPEARSAFPHHQSALDGLGRAFPGRVVGTGHPRVLTRLRASYDPAGITTAPTDDVIRDAAVMVADNTSVGWEYLSTDRPVVWLNAPWYRRNVEHGLRFWEHADAGIMVDDPGDVVDAVRWAMTDPEPHRTRRRDVIPRVYEYTDGKAAIRAAEAIEGAL